jgi:serine/threonine-protein kinase RsbW
MKNSPQPDVKWNYTAKMDSLVVALDAIEQACNARNIDAGLISRARIVVEELFSNTIKYGYGGACDGAIRIGLLASPRLTILYGDDAPLFDPTQWKSDSDVLPDQRPEGRSGVAIVMGLCAHVAWRPQDGRNSLVLVFGA